MDVTRMDRSLGELFSDLSQQTADLIRQEMRLAKIELSDVTYMFAMEEIKSTTRLPLNYLP